MTHSTLRFFLAGLLLGSATLVGAAEALSNSGTRTDDVATSELPLVRNQLGTGTPAPMITIGNQGARYVDDNYYHVPQYLPLYPTAAVIWPRVVEVECERGPQQSNILCEGYHWHPDLGRGEYLFVVPKLKPAPVTVVREIVREVPVPGPRVLVERKKKKE